MYSHSAVVAFEGSVDNFIIKNYAVDMKLGRDQEQRSTLQATERITVDFREPNQNHGLERIFVRDYNGHPTDLKVTSVTDESGHALDYYWAGDALRIGNKDSYVNGIKTYTISYAQRDVTRFYQDTGKDEFYWDVIGTEWRVPIEKAVVSMQVSDSLKPQGKPICYQGTSGSTRHCEITNEDGTYRAGLTDIGSGRGVTIAVGFTKGTFAAYKMSTTEKILTVLFVGLIITNCVVGILGLLIGGVMLYRRYQKASTKHKKEVGETIVPEYLPPPGRTIAESARVYTSALNGKVVTAQLIDWAVRHKAQISETTQKSLLGKSTDYSVAFLESLEDAPETEKTMSGIIVGYVPSKGDVVTSSSLKKRSQSITKDLGALSKSIEESALYEADEKFSAWARRYAKIVLILGIVTLSLPLLGLALVAFTMRTSKFLSVEGERLKRYLDGLKMYIGVAETERFKMMQSASGAERVGEVASDLGARIKLYERVLPYAVLFEQEKSWANELGKLYEQTGSNPSWTTGANVYNAAMLGNMVNGFSSSVTSASDYSSSSGGSGGGGSSGGGGGGGGGGGW